MFVNIAKKIYPSLYYSITDTNIVLKKTFEDKHLLSSELQKLDDSNTNISKLSKTTKKKMAFKHRQQSGKLIYQLTIIKLLVLNYLDDAKTFIIFISFLKTWLLFMSCIIS